LKEDKASLQQLQSRLKTLALPVPATAKVSTTAAVNGKTYQAGSNKEHIKGYSFTFEKGICHFTLATDTATFTLDLAEGKWKEGLTRKPQQTLTSPLREDLSFLYPAKIDGSYGWKDDKTMEVVLRYIESPHSENFVLTFDGDKVTAVWMRSFDFGTKKTTVVATAK
jgi:hypothetical protein